jgi:hypothetical protein
MQFIKSLFTFLQTQTQPAPLASGDDWYCAHSPDGPDRSVRQVVMSFSPYSVTETRFGTIILQADKNPILSMNSCCTGFCSNNQQKVAVFRAGDFSSAVKAAGVTFAVSFCRMPSHPVMLLSIGVEAPDLTAAVRKKYSQVPALTHPIAEWISGLDNHRELASSNFRTDAKSAPVSARKLFRRPNRSSNKSSVGIGVSGATGAVVTMWRVGTMGASVRRGGRLVIFFTPQFLPESLAESGCSGERSWTRKYA